MHCELLTKEENIQKMKFYSTVNFEINQVLAQYIDPLSFLCKKYFLQMCLIKTT